MIAQRVQPRPKTLQAQRLRRAAADQIADMAIATLPAHLGQDRELGIEVRRAVIRRMATEVRDLGGASRAVGVLAGAAAEVCPAYEAPKRIAAAEALFKREGEDR